MAWVLCIEKKKGGYDCIIAIYFIESCLLAIEEVGLQSTSIRTSVTCLEIGIGYVGICSVHQYCRR